MGALEHADEGNRVVTPNSIENEWSEIDRAIAKEFNLPDDDQPIRRLISEMIANDKLPTDHDLISRWLELYTWYVEFCQDATPKRESAQQSRMEGAAEAAPSFLWAFPAQIWLSVRSACRSIPRWRKSGNTAIEDSSIG